MRFLCFHGRGTNAKLFEMQTARIRNALGRDHEFVFANGRIETDPEPGAQDIADEFLGFTAKGDVEQHAELCDELVEYVKTQGPFDGLMGFSEGGGAAGLILLQDLEHHFGFKCAIFFSSALPFDPDLVRKGVIRYLDPTTDGVMVKIPTAHIWSKTGELKLESTQDWAQACESSMREEFVHNLGHAIPGSRSDEGLKETVRAIEHTIEKARARR